MDSDVLNLRDQSAVLRRRWRVLAICTLIGVVLGLTYAGLQKPVYAATADVLVSPTATEAAAGARLDAAEIATQVLVIQSESVAQSVIEQLNLDTSPRDLLKSLQVEQEEDTRVVRIQARSGNPQDSADIANAFATDYISQRADRAATEAADSVSSLQESYNGTADRLATVQQDLDKQKSMTGPKARSLQAEERALTVQLTKLLGELSDADSATDSGLSGGQVLVAALPPKTTAQAGFVRLGLFGGCLGLFLGMGLAFARDHFDDAIRDDASLSGILSDRPVLGRIPRVTQSLNGRLITLTAPQAPASEAFRSLSSSTRFMMAAGGSDDTSPEHRQVLLVTSPAPGEGKTTVASNLAVAAARFGLRVVLVDADLRDPSIARGFGLGTTPGLSDLLASNDDVDSYLIDVGVPGLKVLAGGSVPPNPAELIGSPAMCNIMTTLRLHADLIIVDSAPVTRVADTKELMPIVDLVLLVLRDGVTRIRAVSDSVERIRQVGGRVSGVVLNDVEPRRGEKPYAYDDHPASLSTTRGGLNPDCDGSKDPKEKRPESTGTV